MKQLTKEKLTLAWQLPLLAIISPLLILWFGGCHLVEMFESVIEDGLRWGKYVDDYNGRPPEKVSVEEEIKRGGSMPR